ncbi:putative apoptosis regulator, Bcl-2 protein, BH4 [Septoria linicola]|nr:putative apoptosis regulator, Bcl-2 protein, BH4 [Septoria linicola]
MTVPGDNAFLDVGVIGAGIAGFAAAISLSRAGHQITIYERSDFKNETGAAINMPPQATALLRAWGVADSESHEHDDDSGASTLSGTRRLDAKTAEVLLSSSFECDERDYGAGFLSFHRADLHAALRRCAEDVGVKVVLGKMAVKLNCDSGEVVIVDSHRRTGKETIKKDLIVLADGVHSIFVEHVTGCEVPLHETGRSAYRSLVPMEKLLSDPEARKLFEHEGHHGLIGAYNMDTGVFLIAYPCRRDTLMNIAIFHRMQPEERRLSDWDSPTTIDQALSGLEGFHPAFRAMVRCAEDMRVYTVLQRDPLPNYVNGRVVMIGDAAHPMLPALAGGGSTALEDGAALEVVLRGVKGHETRKLANRLQLWQALRTPRDVTMQVLSKTMLQPQPASSFASEVRHVYTGPLPDGQLAGWIKASRDFVCPYDTYTVTQKALEWAEKEGYPEDMMMRMQAEGIVQHFGITSS